MTAYTPLYPGGWQDQPSVSTPISAAALNNMEAGIKSAATMYNVVSFGADPTGNADSTTAIQAAINAATGTGNPQTGARYSSGPVYIPTGIYKITSDINIFSVQGFKLIGDGPWLTRLCPYGHAFTTAVVNVNGSADGVYGGFSIISNGNSNGTPHEFPSGVNVTWTGPYNATTNPSGVSRSTSGNKFHDIRINGNFVTGFNMSGVGTYQLDGEVLENVIVSGGMFTAWTTTGTFPGGGYWQNGFLFGNGSWGNIYDEVAYGCSAAGCYNGVKVSISSIGWYGGQPAANAIDFCIVPGAQCTISNIQSQVSGQFIYQPAGFSPIPVSVSDCEFVSYNVTTPNVIDIAGGIWDIRNFSATAYSNSTGPVTPVINVRGAGAGRPAVVNMTNVQLINSLFPGCIVTPGANAYINLVNYASYSTITNTYTVTPPMYYQGSAWKTVTLV